MQRTTTILYLISTLLFFQSIQMKVLLGPLFGVTKVERVKSIVGTWSPKLIWLRDMFLHFR